MLILGKGFIGERLQSYFGCAISNKRITHYKDINAIIKKHQPKVMINCIGKRGTDSSHEEDNTVIENNLIANTFIPIMLAETSLKNKIKLVHISTGCMYHDDKNKQTPIKENKTPNYYEKFDNRTKIYSNNVLSDLASYGNILNLRIRVPLDNKPHPKNILTKLIQYKTVIDTPNSVTYVPDFLKAIRHLIKINAKGTYNIVCKGGLRYKKLLSTYQKYVNNFKYKIITAQDLKKSSPDLILSTKKLENSGFPVRTANEVLNECITEYIKY